MNLQLTGYRATGKTTVARHLADLSGWSWLDTDEEIVRRAGTTIRALFDTHGEKGFRDLESDVIRDLAGRPQTVLALGGGAVLRAENRRCLAAGGRAVWLRANSEEIHRRMSSDPLTGEQRPNLTDCAPLEEIRQVLEIREPIYAEFAAWTIDTDDLEPAEIAARIWAWFTGCND